MTVEFEELKVKLRGYENELTELGEALGLKQAQQKVVELEAQSTVPGFWDDADGSQRIMSEISSLKAKIDKFRLLKEKFDDIDTITAMAFEENDDSLYEEAANGFNEFVSELETQRLSTLLSGEYDKNNAILTLHAGAGGTEAQDWALMLYRMYIRWGEKHNFSVKITDCLDGDEAGIKSASILIEGENAYGYMKGEAGVHRLVRISPFDASGRRHTSFASVEVIPEIEDDINIEIRPEDLRVDTYRSSGAGGQHINKTSSAVRITHIPSGIVVACQNERSQFQNKDVAMKMLKSKLLEIKMRENYDRIEDIKGDQREIAWGSQIRSYVFMPYTMVKDHRTSFETGNVNAVMDGELDGFINAYLKSLSLDTLKK